MSDQLSQNNPLRCAVRDGAIRNNRPADLASGLSCEDFEPEEFEAPCVLTAKPLVTKQVLPNQPAALEPIQRNEEQ